jgi:hypothetical protein
MGQVTLTRDPRTGMFSLSAMIIWIEVHGVNSAQANQIIPFEMIADSGSSTTIISEEVSRSCGLDLSRCESQSIGGVGGLVSMPVWKDLPIWILESSGPVAVKLPKIGIMMDWEKNTMKRRGGIMGQTQRHRFSAVSLLGLDALQYLKATLTVTPHLNSATIEW